MESPFKEMLELVKRSSDSSCNAFLMRRTRCAAESGNLEGKEKNTRKSAKWVNGQVEK